MPQTYTYSISGDFPNGKVAPDSLTSEINDSSISTGVLDYINVAISAADNCDIVFDVALSAGDVTTLDGLVAAHQGDPILDVSSDGWDLSVIDDVLTSPPGSPADGDLYIVPVGALGLWNNHDTCVAEWSGSGWEFSRPTDGMAAYVEDRSDVVVYVVGTDLWTPIEEIQAVVETPTGASTPNALVRWDGTGAKKAKSSNTTLNDQDQLEDLVTVSFVAEYNNGTSSGTKNIDWNNAQKQYVTLGANTSFTFTAPPGPCNLLLRLVQDGTGGRTGSWPASVKWPGGTAPTLSNGANSEDIVSFFYNGTDYYGVASLTFS